MIFKRAVTVSSVGLRRPLCASCGGRQWLTRIQPAGDGYGLHSFECATCDASSQQLIAFADTRPATASNPGLAPVSESDC